MTREEFIEVLKEKRYSYEIEGDKLVVIHGRGVWLDSLKTIPSGVKFENGGGVYLNALVGDYFDNWSGNIEGVDSKRLLNGMISKGIFER